MKFTRDIPISELQVGDYFKAKLDCKGRDGIMDTVVRTCQVMEIHGPLLRIITPTRTKLNRVLIHKKQIQGLAWGNRPD